MKCILLTPLHWVFMPSPSRNTTAFAKQPEENYLAISAGDGKIVRSSTFLGMTRERTASGSANKPTNPIVYRVKPNGNTPAVPEPRHRSIPGKRLIPIKPILVRNIKKCYRSGRLRRICSVYMICMATCGSGHWIAGTRTIEMHRAMVRFGWKPMAAIVIAGWFGAVRGTAILGACDRLTVSGSTPMLPSTARVFVSPGFFDL